MTRILVLAPIVFLLSINLAGCNGGSSNSTPPGTDSALETPPIGYTHLIESSFVHPYEELNIEAKTPWEIHFESTDEGYSSVYSGLFWINNKKVEVQGVHWPHYGKPRPCSNVIGSLPMASNSVVIETVVFNDAFQETIALDQPHHKIAFVFPNGMVSGASVHVCLTSFANESTPAYGSLHTLSFVRVR